MQPRPHLSRSNATSPPLVEAFPHLCGIARVLHMRRLRSRRIAPSRCFRALRYIAFFLSKYFRSYRVRRSRLQVSKQNQPPWFSKVAGVFSSRTETTATTFSRPEGKLGHTPPPPRPFGLMAALFIGQRLPLCTRLKSPGPNLFGHSIQPCPAHHRQARSFHEKRYRLKTADSVPSNTARLPFTRSVVWLAFLSSDARTLRQQREPLTKPNGRFRLPPLSQPASLLPIEAGNPPSFSRRAAYLIPTHASQT